MTPSTQPAQPSDPKLGLGVAFQGVLAVPAWPGTVPLPIADAKAAGCDWVSIPVGPADPLSGPLLSTNHTNLATAVAACQAAGLAVLVPPHNDNDQPDAIRLQWFLDFPAYLARFTAICGALKGFGCIVELWNEADYSEADAGRYGLTWGSMQTLYGCATKLAAVARQNGLKVALPLPLDQSPEAALILQQNGGFPWDAMAAIRADYVTGHVYAVAGGLPLRTRLRTLTDTVAELRSTLLLTETNFGAAPWRVTNCECEYVAQGIGRCIWQYVMDPPSTSDFSNPGFRTALEAAHTPVAASLASTT